ncbi:Trypsin Inhibitor like cysteine rich domain protein [Trichostrongylus colubriformis]|uniref:Trypsin Inhibitor like cysteine rich domain protein n=1 Tax=Trichostrongylus colubriformis TaxID=6319 RepID=A0AAN8IP21_TRICO
MRGLQMFYTVLTLCFLFEFTHQNDPISEVCKQNEILTDCGARCEATCIEPVPECEGDCVSNVCRCKQGFIRQELGGECIPTSSCPPGRKQVPPSCDGIVCYEGAHCEVVDVPCENGACPQEAICIDDQDDS